MIAQIKKMTVFSKKLLIGMIFMTFCFVMTDRLSTANTKNSNRVTTDRKSHTDSKNLPDFTDIAKTVIPTVVSIYSVMVIQTKDIWRQQLYDDDLRDFLGERFPNLPIPKEFRQKGSGSGIIVSPQGHILTNVHVIEKAEDIEVTLSDKRTFKATVVGIDPLTEVAVIKIKGNDFPVATLGNSDSCEIGQWVLAVGNPLELNSTVTAGIISAKGRDINIIRDTYGVENFIQTDAAINPGNSGGPLVNLKSEVIGVNTAIATESGYNQGYGFAIPINLAKDIMDDLIQNGRVVRGYLGVSMQDIDEKRARALSLSKPVGVFIDSVVEDGPAARAGLREKDILIKIDNKSVNKANLVQSLITEKDPLDEILLSIIRNNKIIKLNVILGERQYAIMVPPAIKTKKKYIYWGLQVEGLKSNLIEDSGIKDRKGVIVTAVERYSPAFEAGIHVNDVILEIGDSVIDSIETFQVISSSYEKDKVAIVKIRREDTTFHAFIEISE